jgi:tetratricopeptide (TPR) repeat protein
MGFTLYAQEPTHEITEASKGSLFKRAGEHFAAGSYNSTITELQNIETELLAKGHSSKALLGLVAYWKGITYNRLQEFPDAIASFDHALGYGYSPIDLNYEYGQALFASEKLHEARLQFRESIKRNFKRAVSLYYVGFISKEMGERKRAFTFLKAIKKLDPSESRDVVQAAEMQIGDIYLDQVEKHPDAFRAVETYVVPQYQKALELDPSSHLAPLIQEKIVSLQRKYDLILFHMRNGRPTLNPPYFLRLAQEIGNDSNVTFAPTETTIATSKQSSLFSRTSAMGRYTFYHSDYLSISPELNFSYTRYFKREPEIYRNDNYYLAPALRTAYEHKIWSKPASILLDYDYSEVKRDVNAKEKLDFNSRSHGFMLGERFNYWDRGESVIRLRYRMVDSYLDSSDSTAIGFSFEQVWALKVNTLLFYASYDRVRMKEEIFDTDSLTVRGDFIMARVKDWFTPSIGLALTSTDPINDRDARGRELLVNPNVRLARTFSKNWRGNLKLEYQENDSEDEASFAYKKTVYSFELEYLF